MGVFVALGVEALALAHLRRVMRRDASRAMLEDLALARRIDGPAMLLLVLTGLWLATAFWHWHGSWMRMGLLGLLLVGAIGGLVTGRALRRLRSQVGQPGFDTLLRDMNRSLQRSFVLRAALLCAVVYVMSVKPA